MVKLSQFVSRNILTRDKMSQPLVAWRLVLGAWGLTLIPDPYSSRRAYLESTGTNNMDQGSAAVSREFYFMTLSIFHTDCPVKTRNSYDLIPDP